VPKGSETHFKVVVVSSRFDGLAPVRRHQLVYGALATEMKSKPGIHALAITSRTPAEWDASPEANASPKCLGGNGK
jgi:BolA protein